MKVRQNKSIVHDPFDEPSLENLIMEESESECNIVNETSSQFDSSKVTTELNYDDHIKPSSNVKEAILLTYSSTEGIF